MFRLDGSNIFHVMSVPNNEKFRGKKSVFRDCILHRILDGFWGGLGRAFGGCFGALFRNLGILFPICVNIFRLFVVLERQIAKIYSLLWAGGARRSFLHLFWGYLA